jgi:hypothetical protein
MSQDLKNVIRLIESLTTEMHAEFANVHAEFADLKARFDRQDARLNRQGGLLQAGSRSMARMIEWSERADDLWAARDERLHQLEERVQRLEDNHRRDAQS